MADFILELYSEEMPARVQAPARQFCMDQMTAFLKTAQLSHERIRSYVTPQRLVLMVEGLPLKGADYVEEKKGPRVDAPEVALQGFLRASGATLEQCTQENGIWWLRRQVTGRPTADLLSDFIVQLLKDFSWPKSMRWGTGTFRWTRPLHRILAVLDGAILPVTFPLGGRMAPLQGVNWTTGHRFLAPAKITVKNSAAYEQELAAAHVVLDPATRAARVMEQATQLAVHAGFQVRQDEALLQEVAGLVEWPHVLMGRIEAEFMGLPEEVLVTVMRHHQRYFAVERAGGSLAPHFLVVTNTQPTDGGTVILQGNERVLAARFSDAAFYWEQDQLRPLSAWLETLRNRTYHARLGSVYAKAQRMKAWTAQILAGAQVDLRQTAVLAAELAKADLGTGMVSEFPELQGIMGAYYAARAGLGADLSKAIRHHYAPVGPNDRCPDSLAGAWVALSDKIDALVGFFAVDEKPTSSKDPYALRRAALGVIRIVFENDLVFSLPDALRLSYGLQTFEGEGSVSSMEQVVAEVTAFLEERLRVYLRGQGWSHEMVEACFVAGWSHDLRTVWQRGMALGAFLALPAAAILLAAYRRAHNILKKHQNLQGGVNAALFVTAAEGHLWETVQHVAARLEHLGTTHPTGFEAAFEALLPLAAPLDAFFEAVLVEDENQALRINRLLLLRHLTTLYDRLAVFEGL